MLEHAGGLHGVIRSLQLILGVFIKFGNLGGYSCWVMFVDYFLDFNTCKHSIFVIMIIVLGGLLCWSKRVACMMLYKGHCNWYWECLLNLEIWVDIVVELCLSITFWTSILESILLIIVLWWIVVWLFHFFHMSNMQTKWQLSRDID